LAERRSILLRSMHTRYVIYILNNYGLFFGFLYLTSSQSFFSFPVPENMIFLAGRSSHETIKTPFSADSSRDKYEVRGFVKIPNGIELISWATAMIASNSVEFISLVTMIDGRGLRCIRILQNHFINKVLWIFC
jgi:hypothetical protein